MHTAEIHQLKKTLGQIENLVFVIVSTRENIRLIARTSFYQDGVSGFAVKHIDDCFSGSTCGVKSRSFRHPKVFLKL